MQELEKRLRALEIQLAIWKGAFVVASISILAWIGVTAWVTLPNEVNKQLAAHVGSETLNRVKDFNNLLASTDTDADAAAKKLGVHAINDELKALKATLLSAPQRHMANSGNSNRERICPEGTYMVGFKYQGDSGGPHGIISNIIPIYKEFMPPVKSER